MSATNNASSTDQSPAGKQSIRIQEFLRRHSEIILLVLCLLLIALAAILVWVLVSQTFKEIFNCDHLIDEGLTGNTIQFCQGVSFQAGPFHITPEFKIFGVSVPALTIPAIPQPALPLLPPFEPINQPLEELRRFISWNIVAAIAGISLALAFIASKVIAFVHLLTTPAGRGKILSSISLWLLLFAVCCGLFYFTVVR